MTAFPRETCAEPFNKGRQADRSATKTKRLTLELPNGETMEYELTYPAGHNLRRQPLPFLVSVSGREQKHVNGFSRRLPSRSWAVAVPLRPKGAPLFFKGRGAPGDGVWYLHQFCRHLLEQFCVDQGRFLMVGVSNGGNSVLRFATLWPEMCNGLVVVTGSLQGLVEFPAGLQRLKGLPIDMYVGTKDECGFYEPMVAMDEALQQIGHTPSATLTIFKGAGHCCSPMIDDYVLHSKILLLLLYAGATGNFLEIGVPETALPVDEVYVQLICFCEKLGIAWSQKEGGGLEVNSVHGASLQSYVAKPVASMPPQGPVHSFLEGDTAEVWSNYSQSWLSAEVVEVSDQGVKVSFKDDRGAMSKMVLSVYIKDFLRKKQGAAAVAAVANPALASPTPQRRTRYAKGDQVAIWSNSRQTWFEDGEITDALLDGSLMVRFNGLTMSKTLRAEEADLCLRLPRAARPLSFP